jgi:hypothetical protein
MRMQSTATAGLGSHMRTPCPDHQEIMGCGGLLPRRGWGSALGQPVGCVPANMRAVAGYPSPGACQGLSFDVRPTHPCCACHQTNSDAELVRICDPLGCSGARCMPADMRVGMAGMDASVAPSVLRIAHGYPNTRPHIGIAGWVYPNSARQGTRGDMGTGRSTPKYAPRGVSTSVLQKGLVIQNLKEFAYANSMLRGYCSVKASSWSGCPALGCDGVWVAVCGVPSPVQATSLCLWTQRFPGCLDPWTQLATVE